MAPRFYRSWLPAAGWLLALALLTVWRVAYEWRLEPVEAPVAEGRYRVERVIDGDTLRLASGARVRLQGIDTPETVRHDHPVETWGPEASEFTRQFVDQAGGEVRLTFGKERLDRYGRQLAFVWDGDRMLNEELVRAGLARARLEYRYSGTMKRRLAAAQQEARDAARGLWSMPTGP